MYPRLVPKSSPKCFQIVQFRKHQGSNSGGSPKNDFSLILGTSFVAGNAPQIDPKIKTFSGVPQELVLCDGSSQNAPKLPPIGLQNQPFSQEVQNLKILLSPRREPSFRGLDPFKITSFFEPFSQPLSNPSLQHTFPDFSQRWYPKGYPKSTKIFIKQELKKTLILEHHEPVNSRAA